MRASPVSQPPVARFEDLKGYVAVGDTVYVVETSGRESRGKIVSFSSLALTLAVAGTDRAVSADDVVRVDRRRRDSIWNGVLLGAGAGALVGFGLGRGADSPTCPRSGVECGQGALIGTVGGAVWGAIGGWIADALVRKRETIYDAHGRR